MLCSEREAAFGAYGRATDGGAIRAAGYYAGFLCKKVVFCREVADWVPSSFASACAHELTHHLAHCTLGRKLPP
ncbi:MAG: hypothetical protein QGI33_03840 [Candidatus Brocadiia bacterium]|nr:hypothetical protein [Candidatus Brocadiia bacterium]